MQQDQRWVTPGAQDVPIRLTSLINLRSVMPTDGRVDVTFAAAV